MSKSKNECPCSRPVHDEGALCKTCSESLDKALKTLGELVRELPVTETKQARTSPGGRAGSGRANPLPYHAGAARVREDVLGQFRRWAERQGVAATPEGLGAVVAGARMQTWAPSYLEEVSAAAARVARCVDAPPELRYAGPCPDCEADLYVVQGERWVRCDCGAVLDADDRRSWLLSQVEDQLATVAAIAQVLGVRRERVGMWSARGRLVAHGHDGKGRPLYRVSEARALLESAASRGLRTAS